MAFLDSGFDFTGSLGDFSAYRRRDMDKVIIRRKGGASKDKIKTWDSFENTRRNNAEFGGRSAMTKRIMRSMWSQKAMADYNIAGPLNALMKTLQVTDAVNDWGRRSILLSRDPQILAGFSLNKTTLFDSVLRTPVPATISRETLTARVELPEIIPGINFFAQRSHPMFQVKATLGVIPDMVYNAEKERYLPTSPAFEKIGMPVSAQTEWYPVLRGAPATVLELSYPPITAEPSTYTLILAVGICFGRILGTSTIDQVKHAGTARVVACV